MRADRAAAQMRNYGFRKNEQHQLLHKKSSGKPWLPPLFSVSDSHLQILAVLVADRGHLVDDVVHVQHHFHHADLFVI